jgi:hypothetical protein
MAAMRDCIAGEISSSTEEERSWVNVAMPHSLGGKEEI